MAMTEGQPNPIPNPEDPEPLELEAVDGTYQVKGGSHRLEPTGTVNPTGNCRFNSAGSEDLDNVARGYGLKPGAYDVSYGIDRKRNVVAARPVPPGTPGAMPVRRTTDKQLSIHLGGVFRQYPELRPVTTSDCLVQIRKDAAGLPVLMIALQSAQHRSRRSASK